MRITEHSPEGVVTRDMSVTELKQEAKQGNREALKELIDLKGGYDSLTATQKTKVIKLILGYDVTL